MSTITWVVSSIVVALVGGSATLRVLLRRRRNRPDATWKSTGVKRTTEGAYDEAKAVAGMKRSRRLTPTGRVLTPLSRRKKARESNVAAFTRRA